MAIGIDELPYEPDGTLTGMWHVHLRDNMSDAYSGVIFSEGKSTQPIPGVMLRRLVAGMGHTIVRAIRVEDGLVIGEPDPDAPKDEKKERYSERLPELIPPENNDESTEAQERDGDESIAYDRTLPAPTRESGVFAAPEDEVPTYAELMAMGNDEMRRYAEEQWRLVGIPANLKGKKLANAILDAIRNPSEPIEGSRT